MEKLVSGEESAEKKSTKYRIRPGSRTDLRYTGDERPNTDEHVRGRRYRQKKKRKREFRGRNFRQRVYGDPFDPDADDPDDDLANKPDRKMVESIAAK